MDEGVYQTDLQKIQNLRTFLQIFYDRINHLSNLINASTGLILTVLLALLAFSSSIKLDMNILFFLICFSSTALIIWRGYVHYIDNEIISFYRKIINCEYSLDVPENISLLSSLIKLYPDEYATISFQEKYEKIKILLCINRIPARGHKNIDLGVGFVIFGLIFVGITLLIKDYFTQNWDLLHYIYSTIIFCLILFLLAVYRYYSEIDIIPNDPPPLIEWEDFIKKMKKDSPLCFNSDYQLTKMSPGEKTDNSFFPAIIGFLILLFIVIISIL